MDVLNKREMGQKMKNQIVPRGFSIGIVGGRKK